MNIPIPKINWQCYLTEILDYLNFVSGTFYDCINLNFNLGLISS